jgi:trehalose-phosphatase
MLRKLVPDAHIGLFVHAPFPSSEIFRCLPQRREILEGMLGADLACFQAFSYSRHFLSSCIRVCGFEASSNSVESYNGHVTNVSYNPIGIDAEKIARDISAPGVAPKIRAIQEMYKGKKIIIGRDKLDVVRGVIQKLQAFHKLLEEFPQWRDKVVLIQVTAPSMNDSPMLERQVSELVAHINGEFGSLSFTPVHHYHQIIERDEYFALLSVADLAIVSSLRDGMTASTMEFIVAQNNHGKAPLLLSEFSGSAGRLRSAIQINPWATFSSAKAIHHALVISDQERNRRHGELYRQVVSHTSHTWAATLAKQLVEQLLTEQSAHFTPPLERNLLVDAHHKARKRLLLFDYDGTLTPIVRDPEAALPSEQLLDGLKRLIEDERNVVYIISGRDERFLTKHLGHLDRLGFSAEHGGFVKEPGKAWVNLTRDMDMSWKKDIIEVFSYYVERTAGSNIEEKKASVTWHYRNADPDFGLFQCRECQNLLDNLVAQQGYAIEVLVGKKNLECRPLAVNKGEIVKRVLYSHPDAEFVYCAGDDKTDEDMFRALRLLETSASTASATSSCQGSPQSDMRARDLSRSPKAVRKALVAGGNKSDDEVAPSNATTNGGANNNNNLNVSQTLVMSPPTPLSGSTPMGSPKPLALRANGIFTVTIGPSGKKTLAKWHVDGVQRIIDSISELADLADVANDAPSDANPAETDKPQE